MEGTRLAISGLVKKESRRGSAGKPMQPLIINFSDSVCGAGKTEEAIEQIANSRSDFIYAVPTTDLAKSVENRMDYAGYKGLGIEVIRIDGTQSNNVFESLQFQLTKDFDNNPVVVICTHKSLKDLLAADILPIGLWSLLIDEPLDITKVGTVASDSHMSLYTDLFNPIIKLEEIKPLSGKKESTKIIGKGGSDDVVYQGPSIVELCKFVSSKYYNVSALNQPETTNNIKYIAYLDPKSMQVFQSVTMIAAKFKDTLIYHLWSKEPELTFKDCEWNLRFSKHHNGENVSLYYLLKHDDNSWTSSTLYKARNPEETHRNTIKQVLKRIIKEEHNLQGKKVCLLRANKNLFVPGKGPDSSFAYVSGMPFGLNSYDSINAAVYLQTQMPSNRPDVSPWFSKMSISQKNKRATYHSEAYQMVLRCSLRIPTNSDNAVIVVGDKGTADYIADQFKVRPDPKHYPLEALEEVDTEKGTLGRPKSVELDIGEATKRWMSRELKKNQITLPKRITSVGLMRKCIAEYKCLEETCKAVEPSKSCSCYIQIRNNWSIKVQGYLCRAEETELV